MYNIKPNLQIGFHGCDEIVRNELVTKPNKVNFSKEPFDWLGHGFYVWENNQERAWLWAKDKEQRKKLSKPSVLGVVYTLDNCLDFSDSEFTELISNYYDLMVADYHSLGKEIPKNEDSKHDLFADKLIRKLDCAVIEYLHENIEESITNTKSFKSGLQPFDTVRGIFQEGGPAFEGSGIRKKSHIQVCIRNLDCIKGFFIPRN